MFSYPVLTFLRRHKFGCIDAFPLNSRNEEMMGDGFFGATVTICFEQQRLLSTSCNKQGQRSSE